MKVEKPPSFECFMKNTALGRSILSLLDYYGLEYNFKSKELKEAKK
ncbi:hypothetical protein [Methanococcus voltae]|uniref:Uncharacterized protein n=1 Tax=Methanococcus voltae (strain ATCC BAA-1334 / A3) TaxID=456320 RepID=D7DSJ9_METV3|nr:hypothetical protein [Methanococcus voltae]MCS3901708.1 hypothetical protein [Methanococcus voltae]